MSRKSVLRNSGHIARAKEVVVVQPTLNHVPSKQPASNENPLLQCRCQLSTGPESDSRNIKESSDAPPPHPVAVLHVPDELELVQGDLRVLPLELWALPVLVEFLLPLCSCCRRWLSKKGPVCHAKTGFCQPSNSSQDDCSNTHTSTASQPPANCSGGCNRFCSPDSRRDGHSQSHLTPGKESAKDSFQPPSFIRVGFCGQESSSLHLTFRAAQHRRGA